MAAFGLRRVQALFSGSRELAAIVRRDPEHVPERLSLFAVHRLGEPSRLWAREALTDGADPAVVATKLRHQSGRVARIDGAISGTPFFLALVPGYLGYLWQEAMMVLRTAALYGHDPRALGAAAEMLALRGIHPTVEAARAEIEHVNATPLPDKPERRRPVRYWLRSVRMVLVFGGFLSPPSSRDMNRPHAKLLAAVGLIVGAAVWVSTWVFPVTFMVLMAWSCERDARHIGRKALAFYGAEAATTEAANAAARLRHDEGHNWRNLAHAGASPLDRAADRLRRRRDPRPRRPWRKRIHRGRRARRPLARHRDHRGREPRVARRPNHRRGRNQRDPTDDRFHVRVAAAPLIESQHLCGGAGLN